MPYKVCAFCGKVSYSASDTPEIRWMCPYCDQDISDVPSVMARPQDKSGAIEGKDEV